MLLRGVSLGERDVLSCYHTRADCEFHPCPAMPFRGDEWRLHHHHYHHHHIIIINIIITIVIITSLSSLSAQDARFFERDL
jgi:hypothetical protein